MPSRKTTSKSRTGSNSSRTKNSPLSKYKLPFNRNRIIAVAFVAVFGFLGVYFLSSSRAATPNDTPIVGIAGKCLNNKGDQKVKWNPVQLYTCNGTDAQQWMVNSNGTIVNSNGYCLNVYHTGTKLQTPVDIYPCSGSVGQKWTVNVTNHTIVNPHSGLCLNDAHGSTTNRNAIWLYTCNNTAAQKWTVTGTVSPGGGTNSVSGSAQSTSFSVVDNSIENAQQKTVIIHGVDRPSMEWSCNGQTVTGGSGPIPASDFTTMRNGWNAKAVRVPLDQDFWLSGAAKYCSSYQANVATLVKNAQAAGLIVILDLHWSDEGNLANASPGQQCMADQNSITFWQQVASVYKNNPNVWFELYNEPHDISWSDWLNGGSACGYQTAGMQQLYNAVRGTGANNIVIAGGNSWASSLNGLPKLNGTNVAYAIHIYRQTATWSTAGWDSQFDGLENSAPVIATEFGDQVCDGQGFDQALLNYFHQHNVGYTAWAWYAAQCNFTSIISNAAGACTNAATGCVIQKDMESYGSN